MSGSSQEVCEIISATLEVPVADLKPETALRSLPNTESIKVLTVILKVEKRFGIEIPDEATFKLETIGEFIALVEELRSKQRPSSGEKVA